MQIQVNKWIISIYYYAQKPLVGNLPHPVLTLHGLVFLCCYFKTSFCLCKYNIAECPDSVWFIRGCPVAAAAGVVGLFFTSYKWFSVNTNGSGCAWVCKEEFYSSVSKEAEVSSECGKTGVHVTYFVPLIFLETKLWGNLDIQSFMLSCAWQKDAVPAC